MTSPSATPNRLDLGAYIEWYAKEETKRQGLEPSTMGLVLYLDEWQKIVAALAARSETGRKSIDDLILQAKCSLAQSAISGSNLTGHVWLHTGEDMQAAFAWLSDMLKGRESAPVSATRPKVDGVDVPHAWSAEAIKGPRSEPEALVAWITTAKDIGPERTLEVMKKRLARLEAMRP